MFVTFGFATTEYAVRLIEKHGTLVVTLVTNLSALFICVVVRKRSRLIKVAPRVYKKNKTE